MLELVENAFSRHRITLQCSHYERVGRAWKYRNTPGGLEALKCGQGMKRTTGRCIIKLVNKNVREEWMHEGAEVLVQQENISMRDEETAANQSNKRILINRDK